MPGKTQSICELHDKRSSLLGRGSSSEEEEMGSGRERVSTAVDVAVIRRKVAFRGYACRGKWVRVGSS